MYYFSNEQLLLQAFDLMLMNYDPDVMTGYNILSFDLKYLLDRRNTFDKFEPPFWGRIGEQTNYKEAKFNSKSMGFRTTIDYNIFGWIVLDMYIHMMKETKLSSYKLNYVAYELLGQTKEEVHHTQISVL